jgi:hypothetical protein
MKHPFFKRFAPFFLIFSFAVPATAFAATPQQILNTAVASLDASGPLRLDTEVTLNVMEKTVRAPISVTEGVMKFFVSQRRLPVTEGRCDSEGRFEIRQIDVKDGDMPFMLDAPIAIQWKIVACKLYVRLESVPPSIIGVLKDLEVDVTPVVGQWASIDMPTEDLPTMLGDTDAAALSPFMRALEGITSKDVLRVVRVEKRETRPDGHVISRFRVRVNPLLVSRLQAAAIKDVSRTDPDRRSKINAIYKDFAKIRRTIANLHMVAIVDETAGTMQRMEFGIVVKQPKKTCTWNSTFTRQTCRTTSNQTFRIAAGQSYLPDSGAPVIAPTDAIPFETLMERLNPPEPVEATSTDATLEPSF